MRNSLRAALAAAVLAGGAVVADAAVLIPKTTASRHGLTRSWYAQVGAPRTGGNLAHVVYDNGLVLAQSTRGKLTAIEGETGRTLWSTQVGPHSESNTEPAANDKYVVVMTGSTLYALDRQSGRVQWQRRVSGAPGAGPAISATHVFVPLLSGKVEGYELDKGAKQAPWNYKSSGRVLSNPVVTAKNVTWTTEGGFLYVASAAANGIRYRLETRNAIHARPTAWAPLLFAGSTDGYVYAVNESKGKIAWKYPLGDAIYEQPVAINDKLFVVSELSGMQCLNCKTGAALWRAPRIKRFLAASPTRVYVVDAVEHLNTLDIETGLARTGLSIDGITHKVVNTRSDRIYLADGSNVVQCLHEALLTRPVLYQPPVEETKVETRPLKRRPPAADTPNGETSPGMPEVETPDAPEEPADGEPNPFDTVQANP